MTKPVVSAAIAFFPWISIDEPIEIEPLRLLPYRKGKSPGDLPQATQADIDGVLNAYANRPKNTIKKATLLELGEWRTGMDAQDVVPDLFRARNAIAFAALSARKIFHHFGYSNYDSYSLVIQRYTPGDTGMFAFTTRRRDGGTTQVWSSNEFAFHRPNHVDLHTQLTIDKPLLKALLSRIDPTSSLFEAVTEFNCANTDSSEVPPHVEIVMMKSAFEWLFKINENVESFVAALNKCLGDLTTLSPTDGPLKAQWESTWPKATRPLEAWAKEFCALRGVAAHGQSRVVSRFVWQPHTHLAFASLLFPLIYKKVIAGMGFMELDNFDIERLKRIDAYIVHDPFTHDIDDESEHPWRKIDSVSHVHARAPLFYNVIKSAIDNPPIE